MEKKKRPLRSAKKNGPPVFVSKGVIGGLRRVRGSIAWKAEGGKAEPKTSRKKFLGVV